MDIAKLAPLLLLSSCHSTPGGTPIPTVVVKGVSTDDIRVVVSDDCDRRHGSNYCESLGRALARSQRNDRLEMQRVVDQTEAKYRQ